MAGQDTISFKLETRQQGKHWSRAARLERKVPAVVYGPKVKNVNVLADEIAITKHKSSKYESTIFKLESGDSTINNLNVLLKHIQFHPVSGRPVHADFFALDMDSTVKVNVKLNYEGIPVGVKDEGGLLQIILNEVELECNPTDMPDAITVDVSGLALNSAMHVSDLNLPSNVTLVTAADRTIASVAQIKEEKEPEVSAAPAEGADAAAADAATDGDKKAEEKKK